MSELAAFPLRDQLTEHTQDGRPAENARMDCVMTSTADAIQWLTGTYVSGDTLKDAVYGESYTGGTSAKSLVAYVAQHYGVKLDVQSAPNQAGLIAILRRELAAGHPTLITMPSAWGHPPADPMHPGSSHVGVAYGIDAATMVVMNPWHGFRDARPVATWQRLLCYGQVWPLSRLYVTPTGLPGWQDDGVTLTAPNGHRVIAGFRKYVLAQAAAGKWEPANMPAEEERGVAQLELSNPALGGGSAQVFYKTLLEWTASRGVLEAYVGLEYLAYRAKVA